MNRTLNKPLADDLVRPLFHTSVWFYAIVLATGTVVACGAVAWGHQLWYGIGLSGKRWPTFWALYLTNFVFWIGISHAGTLISAILRLVNAGWRRPVTRCAEVITVFALMIGAMFPIIHLGRPWLAFWLFPVSERARDLAELPLAAGVGLLRHQHLSHRQRAVPVPADDSRPRAGARSLDRLAPQGLRRAVVRLARHDQAVEPSRIGDADHGDRDPAGGRVRCTPSCRSTSRWPMCRCGTRRSSVPTSSPARSSAASPR
jgi:hypothetical protein